MLDDAEVELRQNGVVIANGGKYNFGATTAGNALEKTFSVYNRGGAALNVGSASLDGTDFSITAPLNASSIAPGDSVEFTVSINSSNNSEVEGTLSFTTDDSDETTYYITLIGTVEAASSVNDFSDTVQADGKCTLREVILNANASWHH